VSPDEHELSSPGEDNPLHRMMERAGEQVDVLGTLHDDLALLKRRYLLFARVMLASCTALAAIAIAALVIGIGLIGDVTTATSRIKTTANTASDAAAAIQIVSAQNRQLINRLDTVAKQAQRNGARTDATQCRDIEDLKRRIRSVLEQSPAGTRFLGTFRRERCSALPNAKVVTP